MLLKILMYGALLLSNSTKIKWINFKITKYQHSNVQLISLSLQMVRLALLVQMVNFSILEQSHVQIVKINKNISLTLMNANNFIKNLTMIQAKTGSHKIAIANRLTTNWETLSPKVFQFNNARLINHSLLRIWNHV